MYAYEIKDGHLITMIDGKRVLVDTGSPANIGEVPNFSLNGQHVQLQRTYQGADIAGLSKLLGFKIDILLGCDCLNKYDVEIETKKKTIAFHDAPKSLTGAIADIVDDYNGIPIVQVKIDAKATRMYFDTGARLSYIESTLTSKFKAIREVKDFHPSVGRFQTMTYEVPAIIHKDKVNLTCGVLPASIEKSLLGMADNVHGILGSEIFDKYSVIYAPRRRKICFIS